MLSRDLSLFCSSIFGSNGKAPKLGLSYICFSFEFILDLFNGFALVVDAHLKIKGACYSEFLYEYTPLKSPLSMNMFSSSILSLTLDT